MFEQYKEMGSGGEEKKVWKVLLVILIFASLFAITLAEHHGLIVVWSVPSGVVTLPPTGVGTSEVTLNGNLESMGGDAEVATWFEWGLNTGGYVFKTDNQIRMTTGNFSQVLKSPNLYGNKTYKYRAAVSYDAIEYGEAMYFTMDSVPEIADKDYGKYFEAFDFTDLSATNFATPILMVWIDAWGAFFWVILFGIPFLLMFITQYNTTIPGFIALATGAGLFVYLPPEWQAVAQGLLIVSVGGIIIGILKSSRR